MICKDEEERAYRKLIEQGLKCYNQEDGGEGTIEIKQKNIFFLVKTSEGLKRRGWRGGAQIKEFLSDYVCL